MQSRPFRIAATASPVAAGVAEHYDGQPRSLAVDIGADEYSGETHTLVDAGCVGSGATTPKLDLWSWPFLGNPSFAIGFEDTPPNSIVDLFGSLGICPVPLPIGASCNGYLDPASFVALAATTTNTEGSTAIVLPVPNNPAFVGFNIGYQGLVLDVGATLGFTVTNGIDTTFNF